MSYLLSCFGLFNLPHFGLGGKIVSIVMQSPFW